MRRPSRGRAMLAPPGLFLFSILTFIILLVAVPAVHGQQRWRYFDSLEREFQIGAINIPFPRTAKDTLGIGFTRLYHIDNAGDLTRQINNPGNWLEALRSDFWTEAQTIGYKITGPLPRATKVQYATFRLENYTGYDFETMQAMPFERGPDTTVGERDTTVMHALAWGLTIPEATNTATPHRLMAGGPKYTASRVFFLGDRGLYNAINQPLGWTKFRVGWAMKIDTANETFRNLLDATILSYAILYRRVRTGQESCKCHIYEPFDTINIRKDSFVVTPIIDRDYREVNELIDFARAMEEHKHDSIIIQRVPVYENGTQTGTRDSITQTFTFYDRDSLIASLNTSPGCICIPARRDTFLLSANPEIRAVRSFDTLLRFHVPLYVPDGNEFAVGYRDNFFGYASSDPACIATCSTRFANGEFPPGSINEPIEDSDFHLKVYSTGVVPITFLRTSIHPDLYDRLRAGQLDTYIRADIDSLYAPSASLVNEVHGRIATIDEPVHHRIRTGGVLSRKIQGMMRAKGDTARQMFHNPTGNFDGFRLLMEDFDSISVKTVQLMTRQDYRSIGSIGAYNSPTDPPDRVPVFYANPDKMDTLVMYTVYRARDSMPRTFQDSVFTEVNGRMVFQGVQTYSETTPRNRMIAFNNDSDYQAYTAWRQGDGRPEWGFGKFLDHSGAAATIVGPLVQQVARAVDVGKLKYRRFGPPCPVYNMIQTGAWINRAGYRRHEPGGYWDTYWSLFRPPTPEEITAQVWLTLNCGADGIIYSDGTWDGNQLGFIHAFNGDHHKEYDTLRHANPDVWRADTFARTLPKMWIGFNSRFNTMRRVNMELKKLDSIVHLTELGYNKEQMSLHDTRQTFAGIPMLDTVYTRQVRRHTFTPSGGFLDSSTADPRNETYMEVTHFRPGMRDTVGRRENARYILFTNRRTYPIDTTTYGAVAQSFGAAPKGLGAIDVRRPIIRLKNSTGIIVDSFVVEKVGYENQWRDTFAIGEDIPLDHLQPGWGAMYRVKPIVTPVSAQGTAYNNAVHAENTSTGTESRNRVVTYERDSAIFLRVMDGTGTWGREFMISDPADTQRITVAGGAQRRRAHNLFPAIATVRNMDGARRSAMVVWERRDSNDWAGVEVLYIDSLPTRTHLTYDTVHLRLAQPAPRLMNWMQLNPSIVGLDSGYVVAWASPAGNGTEVIAIRDRPINAYPTIDFRDTSRTLRVKMKRLLGTLWFPGDTVAQYPTLAHPQMWELLRLNGGQLSSPLPQAKIETEQTILGVDTLAWFQRANLAYQQGRRNNTKWLIMHHVIGADFPAWPGKPVLFTSDAEHASVSIPGCEYVHPSIAADSVSVGLTFETVQSTGRTVTLRFRDTGRTTTAFWRWNTPYYKWGGVNMMGLKTIGYRKYERPSVTQFPSLDTNELRGLPEGSIVWQWTNAPGGRRNHLMHYRYGETHVDTLPDGMDPTMVLAPYVNASRSQAFASSSVFHRGSDVTRFIGKPIWSVEPFYYPAAMENTPNNPNGVFVQAQPRTRTIMNGYKLSPFQAQYDQCAVAGGGMSLGVIRPVTRKDDDSVPIGTPPPPPWEFDPPPTFFPPFRKGPREILTIADAAQVARTGTFGAGDSAVTVRRVIAGSPELIPWLNTQPNEPGTNAPANIMAALQLIRESDGAVLWSSAIVTARTLGDDTLDDEVAVPVHQYATPDTAVYIRLFATTTAGMEYSVGAGYHFLDEEGTSGGTFKRNRGTQAATPGAASAIMAAMVPNPMHSGEGELHLSLPRAGRLELGVYDLMGMPMMTLGELEADGAGEYAMPVDLSGLGNGTYLVRVRMGEQYGIARFVVMR